MATRISAAMALAALVAVLAVCSGVSAQNASGVVFLDSPARGFLREAPADAEPSVPLSRDTISGLLSSFLGIAPATPVTPQVAQQMDDLSAPNLFNKPAVVFNLNLAGVGPEEGAVLLEGRTGMLRKVDAGAHEVMSGMDSVFMTMPGTVQHFPLDFNGMQDCDIACLEAALSSAASRMGGAYQPSEASNGGAIGGILTLKNGDGSEEVSMDLSNEAERVFAMEVAALHKRAAEAVAAAKEDGMDASSAKLMDCTMAGPQMLRDAHGAESPEFTAAVSSVSSLASSVLEDLHDCHDGKALGQIALLGDVRPQQPLLEWRSEVQPMRAARMLQEEGGEEEAGEEASGAVRQDTGAAGAQWSKTALTWTTFWVLLWFTWMGIYSLCTMPFKQDSLLYSKNKSE